MEPTEGLQKTMKDILLMVLFYIKCFLTFSPLLQAYKNKTSIFYIKPRMEFSRELNLK